MKKKMLQQAGKMIAFAGAFLLLLGGAMFLLGRLGLGRMPGDFYFSGKNWKIYLPIGTCILISLILTLLIYVIQRFRR
jgi:hypothetical protein